MATNAISANGTLLQIGDGATPTEAFTTIAEVKTIGGPTLSARMQEVIHHSGGGWVDKLAILLDAGDVSFEINFIPTDATHSYAAGLLKDFYNKTRRNFKLIFPDAGTTTWQFAAFVSEFESNAPSDNVLTASVTLTVTGVPTLE